MDLLWERVFGKGKWLGEISGIFSDLLPTLAEGNRNFKSRNKLNGLSAHICIRFDNIGIFFSFGLWTVKFNIESNRFV